MSDAMDLSMSAMTPNPPDSSTSSVETVETTGNTGFSSEVTGPPIFSPTQTDKWLACRRKWQLDRMGYRKRVMEWEPNKLLGSACHAAFAALNLNLGEMAAREMADTVLQVGYVMNDKWSLSQLHNMAFNGALAAHGHLQSSLERVTLAEKEIHGCIPDLITQLGDSLIVTQLKTSLYWKQEWWEKRRKEYEFSWQLLHEAWAARQQFNAQVRTLRVIHVGFSPRVTVRSHEWPVENALIDMWEREWAYPTWYAMERDKEFRELSKETNMPGNPRACLDYGGCEYQLICWAYAGDMSKAMGYYDKEEAR